MIDDALNAENEEDLWAAAAEDLVKQKEMLRDEAAGGQEEQPVAVQSVEAAAPPSPVAESPVPAGATVTTDGAMGRILDLPLKITVELGRTKMLINDLMQLGQGSVIELSKLVGEPLEILVNEKLIGKGEVVVINEKFGVRLTEVATPEKRIENLG